MKEKFMLAILFCLCLSTNSARAQMFSDDDWDDQHFLIMGKYSQLFYELNFGITGSKESYADFVYFSVGYGKPNTKNAWRKFLPESQQSAPTSKDEMLAKQDDSTSGLHAGTIGIGWQHFFNHWIGFHAQAGWGFIADLGGGNSSSSVTTSSSSDEEETKATFIYNTVPVQAGIDFNLWNNFELQVGATYLWKEIPIITIGLGVVF